MIPMQTDGFYSFYNFIKQGRKDSSLCFYYNKITSTGKNL